VSKPPLTLALATALLATFLAASPRAWAAPPCGQAAKPMLLLTSLDNDRSLEISPGSQIQLTLAENPSTGYRWSLAPVDPALVELVSEQSQASPAGGSGSQGQSRPVGSPGEVIYRFKALRAGTTEISLRNMRSWEGDRSTIERFRVSLHIRAQSASQGGPHPGMPTRP
jgi:inhibitor of cysteine peptidase